MRTGYRISEICHPRVLLLHGWYASISDAETVSFLPRNLCGSGFLQASQFWFFGCWWHQIAYGQKTIAKDELKLQCRRIRDQSDSFKDLCQTFPRAGFLSKSKQFRVEIIFSNKSKLESLFSWDRMLVFHLRVCQKSGLDFETAECGCNTTGLT